MNRYVLQTIRYLASPLARARSYSHAGVAQRIADALSNGDLDLARQAECLLRATAHAIATQRLSLLLLCPEWNVVGVVQPSSSPGLERTELAFTSPVVQWIQNQDTAFVQWSELVVLPQIQGVPAQDRGVFERLEAQVLVPLRVNGSLTGILVIGPRVSGDPYGRQEFELLTGIARAAARSIENARLYAVEQANVAELRAISEMKSEYIMSISHQLKTPISAVKASAEMLSEPRARSPEFRQRLVNAIVRGADSLDRLVTELTEYGKMRSAALELNKVESSLASIVSDACALLQPLVDDKRLRLRVEAPSTLPRIVVDPHRVQQVLFNLLSNAIKFTPAGGEITVRVSRDGDHLLTQVEDSGPGIPEDQQRRVFEAFHGASDMAQRPAGSGLGLAIARALTGLHGGTIWVESQEGKGSTFSFTLPLGP